MVHSKGGVVRVGFGGVVPAYIVEGVGSRALDGDGLKVVGPAAVGVASVGEGGTGHGTGVAFFIDGYALQSYSVQVFLRVGDV